MASLWDDLTIKQLQLQNRLVMPPMALDIAGYNGEVTERLLEHYSIRARAKGAETSKSGLGLIIVEHGYVHPDGKAHAKQLGVYDDSLLPGLGRLAEAIHTAGTAAGMQISHAGIRGIERMLGPSAIPNPLPRHTAAALAGEGSGKEPLMTEELDAEAINHMIDDFARAAARARQAGFDLVEIHCAHGYLLNQFLSPLTNRRRDDYGGNLEHRMRLPLEVLAAVRQAVGDDYPVFIRLGADDRMEGSYGIEEGARMAAVLAEAGADCLDLSGGLGSYMRSGPEGFFVYMADAVKKVTAVPVLVTGGVKTGSYADKIIRENHADLVGVGRSILADPNWPVRAWQER